MTAFFIILFVFVAGMSFYKAIKTSSLSKINYQEINIDEMYFTFVSIDSNMTLTEKDDAFQEYINKTVISKGIIKNVDFHTSSDTFIVTLSAPDDFELTKAKLYLKRSQNPKMTQFQKGDNIKFSGIIEDYEPISGILIREAEIQKFD